MNSLILYLGIFYKAPVRTDRAANRVGKNLENANLNLIQKLEVFWGLASKTLNILNPNYPQNLILNLKNAVLILTSNFEIFSRVLKKPQVNKKG